MDIVELSKKLNDDESIAINSFNERTRGITIVAYKADDENMTTHQAERKIPVEVIEGCDSGIEGSIDKVLTKIRRMKRWR